MGIRIFNKKSVALLIFFGVISIQSVFAGPFGIDMGMSLAQVKAVCKTTPEHIQDNVYEITPPKTNDMFQTYYVRIDPEYGVYWLKAIGKDIYTNGYGERLTNTFDNLIKSIKRTYGEVGLYMDDSLKEGSIWNEPKDFMYALQQGDRTLRAAWTKTVMTDAIYNLRAQREALKDPDYLNYLEKGDTIAMNNLVNEKKVQFKKLPSDIAGIGVFTNVLSTSLGFVSLEYSFSNEAKVDEKADSVF